MTMDGRPSRTAVAVALARGLGGVDPLAQWLLPRRVAESLRASNASPMRRWPLRIGLAGLVPHLQMRTRAIDAACEQAHAAGIRDVVVLGAGLDSRAFRLGALADARFFEVDHPATGAAKARRVAALTDPLGLATTFRDGSVRWQPVPVDFAQDDLGAALATAGQDAARPTLWIWEGVTMYLPRAAMQATLARIAGRSAVGSRLVVSYMVPSLALPTGVRQLALAGFRALGEPLLGPIGPEAMADALAAHGFSLLSDESHAEWASRFGVSRLAARAYAAERLAVARRDA
ncbi:MAG: hypothetical protein RIT45_2703 [Pseudomonadota bacterium]|jgi:methyltransferase (TIGR00027 family)